MNRQLFFTCILFFFLGKLTAQDSLDLGWLEHRLDIAMDKSTLAYQLLNKVDQNKLDQNKLVQFDKQKIDNWKRIKRLKLVKSNLELMHTDSSIQPIYSNFGEVYSATHHAANFGKYWNNLEAFLLQNYSNTYKNDSLLYIEMTRASEQKVDSVYNLCLCTTGLALVEPRDVWHENLMKKEKEKCESSRDDLVNIYKIFNYLNINVRREGLFDGLLMPCKIEEKQGSEKEFKDSE